MFSFRGEKYQKSILPYLKFREFVKNQNCARIQGFVHEKHIPSVWTLTGSLGFKEVEKRKGFCREKLIIKRSFGDSKLFINMNTY